MRITPIYALVLFVALALAGCSAASGTTQTANPTATTSSDPTVAAIQAVIQKADQEQQDAFAKNDPTLMKDTATSSYYNQLVQINSQMASSGVSAIKLLSLEWGPINLTSSTTAQATTFETWQTTFSDGTTEQAREQNDYTLVLQQGIWLIQTDDHPNSTSGGSGGSPASGPSGSIPPGSPTAVPPPAATPASGASVSRNWAGYAATSGSFTAVSGTWTVPQMLSSGSSGTDATWVGMGGVNSRDLIQAGTEETTIASGDVVWDAWIEMLPQTSRQVRFAIHPGDSVTVSITQQGSNQWLIQFKNNTTGESYQTTTQYTSSLSSADWIEEAPSAGGRGGLRILPLDNFGSVQFSGGTTVQNGKSVTIAQAGAQPIALVDSAGNTLVTPSVLTPDGQGFTVTRSSSATAP